MKRDGAASNVSSAKKGRFGLGRCGTKAAQLVCEGVPTLAHLTNESPMNFNSFDTERSASKRPRARWFLLACVAPLFVNCTIKTDSDGTVDIPGVGDVETKCDEFTNGGTELAGLDVNAKVKAFSVASAELRAVSDSLKVDVKAACVKIAVDLGETDRWTNDPEDTSVSNPEKTGACDVAASRIDAIMTASVAAGASFALDVSGAECHVDTVIQKTCEDTCKTDTSCTEAKIEERCEPGQLSVKCEAECKAEAVCQGQVDVAANCMGKCESECQGTCSGELYGTVTGGCEGKCEGKCDGVATPKGGMVGCAGTCEGKCSLPKAGAQCTGKCAASCNGKCKGECKIEASAGVKCGATVSCKGGCTGTYSEPTCETELTPGVCTTDTICQTSCSAQAVARTICSGPHTTLRCDVSASEDVAKLKATLDANLPAIFIVAKAKGKLIADALDKVQASGQAVIDSTGEAGSKSFACATVAAAAAVQSYATATITLNAAASVRTSCSKNAG